MENKISDIYDWQAPNLINKLINFIGLNNIDKCLKQYKFALESSGPIFRDYYLKTRHPWWDAFLIYFDLLKKGKSIRRNLSIELKLLAGDALKIVALQKSMPKKIKEKYRLDLIDDNNAKNYLFEIDIAWHFFQKDCKIKWHDDDSSGHSEFLVKTPSFDFNVECKKFSADISRKIRRRDFYRFAEKLLASIQQMGYSGTIDIELNDRLHSNDNHLNELRNQVINQFKKVQRLEGYFQIPLGSVRLNLKERDGIKIGFDEVYMKLHNKLNNDMRPNFAHGAIFAESVNQKAVDPVEITMMSRKVDNVLDGIRDRISKAAKRQLDKSIPGLIVCFIEGIDHNDLIKLSSNSGLQIMTNFLFSKPNLNHIAVISYCSEPVINKSSNSESYYNQELHFRNHNCKFEIAKNYNYFNPIN